MEYICEILYKLYEIIIKIIMNKILLIKILDTFHTFLVNLQKKRRKIKIIEF